MTLLRPRSSGEALRLGKDVIAEQAAQPLRIGEEFFLRRIQARESGSERIVRRREDGVSSHASQRRFPFCLLLAQQQIRQVAIRLRCARSGRRLPGAKMGERQSTQMNAQNRNRITRY